MLLIIPHVRKKWGSTPLCLTEAMGRQGWISLILRHLTHYKLNMTMNNNDIQLRTSLFEFLERNIDLNKEARIKIGKCHNFFASILLKNEITSSQFMSIVGMTPCLRTFTFDVLVMLRPCHRKSIFMELANWTPRRQLTNCIFQKDLLIHSTKRANEEDKKKASNL